jgi:phosphatidate cytidylyltransferase
MVARRILTAVVGLPVGIFILYLGGTLFTVGVGLLALLGMGEYCAAAAKKGLAPSRFLAYCSIPAFLLAAHFTRAPLAEVLLFGLIAVFTLVSLATPALQGRTTAAIGISSTTLTAILYIGFLFSFLVLMRGASGKINAFAPFRIHLEAGFVYVLYLFSVSWLTDTGAFFFGRALGKQKLAPRISPNKTIEGSVGGVLLALLIGVPLAVWMGLPFRHAAILALLGSIAGQVGDLAKSAIKRDAGIKDFGSFFPGHGGVLDRFDSVIFNAPLFYFYLRLVGL